MQVSVRRDRGTMSLCVRRRRSGRSRRLGVTKVRRRGRERERGKGHTGGEWR